MWSAAQMAGLAGVVEIEEQGLVEQLIARSTIHAINEAILHRRSRRDEVPVGARVLAAGRHGVAGELVPWSDSIIPGLPRRSMMPVSSRATRCPEIDVS